MNEKKYKTLVLSGNSTNSVVSLGALQYMYDHQCLDNINVYVAVSSGTIISVLLSIGYTPLEIISYICFEQVYKTIPPYNLLNTFLSGQSAISFNPIRECLEQMITSRIDTVPTLKQLFERTGKNIIFTVYNLTDHKREYISYVTNPNLSVTTAIQMSCNFPILFDPYVLQDKSYIDGGIADSFPIEYAINKFEEPILGIYIKNPLPLYDPSKAKTLIVFDLLHIMFAVFTESILEDKTNRIESSCDIIKLTQKSNFFNFNSTRNDLLNLFDTGYKKAKTEVENSLFFKVV